MKENSLFYRAVYRPYDKYKHFTKSHRHYNIRSISFEDMLNNYYDYKEGLEDARAQADRWRY